MSDVDRVATHSVAGLLLLTVGVLFPALLATAAALVPGLDWIRGPEWAGPSLDRAVVLALGAYLLAAGYGFVLHRRWAWWMVAVWGVYGTVQAALTFLGGLPAVRILVIPVGLVALLGYALRRRGDFGVLRAVGSP